MSTSIAYSADDSQESQHLINPQDIMTPINPATDIFKHENESVDLLLREINPHIINNNNNNNNTPGDSSSIFNSPTKPLYFPNARSLDKELVQNTSSSNNSSDTYTSENEKNVITNSNLNSNSKHDDSFLRNFEDSGDFGVTTIQHPDGDAEDFSFVTPMTSTVELVKPGSSSPSKSIMKTSKTPINSPKKNVVFTNSTEIHHYQLNSADTSNNELQPPPPAVLADSPIDHKWNKLNDNLNLHDVEDEDDFYERPPVPPPHVNNSFENLLNNHHNNNNQISNNQEDDKEIDSKVLNEYKLKHDKFSNLSLNEKLDLFLSNHQNQDQQDLQHNQDHQHDLDTHLDDLNEAAKKNVTSNIFNLSLSLATNNLDELENPLNSLSKSDHVQLRSSGSSQSSLQSLRDDNRVLDSMPNLSQSGNNGIQLNDGIKGFSDEIVEQLVPQPEEEDDDEHDGLIMKKPSTAFNKEAADTFDNSYNNSTEQSIMNLLKSASQSNLDQIESKEINETTTSISKPTLQDIKVKDESEDDIHIKEEDEDEQKLIKQEQDQDEDVSLEEIKQEESSIFTAKFETVSDVGRSSNSPRLVSPSSMTPIIRPLIDQIETPTNETDEDSELSSRDSTKMSIRFHMDSQWKLEDSQDGDKEDNDENGFTTTINDISQAPSEDKEIQLNQPILNVDLSPNVSATSQPFEDASDDLISKTLAPSRIEDEEQQQEEVEQEQPQDSQHEHTEENVLANSSNIAPPEELTLPPVETHNYSSFDEITRNVGSDKDSFEESLSAEHESDKKASDFLSIWHLQERQKKNPRTGEFFKVLDNKETIITPESQSHTIQPQVPKIPLSLQQKKFKEVNVITRKVVNPEFEELQVSGFLPELSEDSGFENHFNFLRNTSNNNYSNMANNRRSFSPLSTKNVLSNIDNDPNVIEPPAPNSNTNSSTNAHTNSIKRKFLRNSISVISATASIQHQPTVFKSLQPLSNDNINNRSSSIPKSKFKVPSFEIKRSNSVLSPRDFYNDDIFADTIVKKPTIKSSGMKTLPSMDREDVKRILSTKRVITQDEYAKVKLRGLNIKKNSIVNEPNDKYDELQQQASIHNVSPESSPSLKFAILPHLAGELLQAPNALLSKDQFFKDYQIFNNGNKTGGIQQPSVDLAFPEPDPELINSPNSNIFKTPPKADIDLNVDDTIDDVQLQKHLLPNESPINIQLPTTPKKSPIKIGSPMKLVKQGDKVTGAIIPASPKKTHKPQVSFSGDEIINSKLRGENSPRKDSIAEENDDEQHKPSTVSVPSAFTNSSRPSGTSSATLLNFGGNHEYRTLKEEQQQLDHSQDESNIDINPDVNDVQETEPKELQFTERGKLFFRVIGLKNINLPDLDKHNAELSITLDNGVHCIKTPNYKLESNNVLIGKEFELTVGESLAFILTMKMNYEKPRGGLKEVHERKVVKSKNKLGRMFGSKDIVTVTKFVPFEVKDSWEHKFAQDGSFGRCYIDLEQFEDKITGKALNFNLNCFNEWDKYIDPTTKELTKGKAYRIGQLEVKMLFVPRVDAREVLPTSIKSAYEGVHELGQEFNLTHEGYLHQEGGDCEIWKKRFFKLYGTSLIAHSEFSHKTRAKINLAKIVEVIYVDKENIKNSSTNYRNFSDVLLVEHAFKIRFANGEIIDFGAPNKSEKMQWISIFEKITHRNKFRRQPWVKLMLQEAGYVNAPQQLQQEDQKPQNEVISSRSSMIL